MSKIGVFQRQIRNKSGFTLIGTLISLSIFLLIVSLVPPISGLWADTIPDQNSFSYEEFVIFTTQLQVDFRKSTVFSLNNQSNKIYFDRPEDQNIVHYEQYQDKIRRQVSEGGHEVFLQRINSFHVQEIPYGVVIEIEANENTYKKVLTHPSTYIPMVTYEEGEEQ
ncbi:competence type IV pilus minor pilin ComGF [Salipaludibacillus neizhouensis]|uniref:competence type IV pilus minor pilin ComGF n=1 Tax=Salipaludibacillus neizhouensis TaxID=885475 RepID=UPI001604485C|nr:competence type IV pilus minor pilin ComGF [Salipaludibacillus neizhouensis]